MQVQTQNIQRPALFSDFFGLELMWNNEYLTYIHTFFKRVTSQLNNIKKTLNTKKFFPFIGYVWFSYQYENNDSILSLSLAKLLKKLQKKDTEISKILKIYTSNLNHDLRVHKFNLGAVA